MMKALKNILVIVDKPKHEQGALRRALRLQAQTGANLHLKSFIYHAHVANGNAFTAKQRTTIRRGLLGQQHDWLMTQGTAASDTGEITREVVWASDIAAWVASYVKKHPQDIVVKAVNHTESLIHTPLDWEMLRTCPTSLLLCAGLPQKTKPRILAAIDMNNNKGKQKKLNKKVLGAAAYFAKINAAELHCVYTVEISEVLSDLGIIQPRKHARDVRAQILPELEALLEPYGVPTSRIHMPVGKVGRTVSKVASKIKAELLVLGTSGRSGVGALVLGNSAEKVLQKSHCEVLAIKL
jgi:universal stress protein E